MDDQHKGESKPPPSTSSEYGDALTDVLQDQARRNELRKAAALRPSRARLHPTVPPVLAFISIWLWAFPPEALRPVLPSIPPANQEAGLRMEMYLTHTKIQRFLAENGRLPNGLADVGDISDAVRYVPLALNVYRLSGQTGDIVVEFTSTEPEEDLLGDARAIVSGMAPSNPEVGASNPGEGAASHGGGAAE